MNPSELFAKSKELRAEARRLRLENGDAHAAEMIDSSASALDDAAHQLQRQAADLKTSNGWEVRFISNLSHELRTPLTPMLLLVSSLLSEPSLSAEMRADLFTIREQIEIEARLVEDLLDATHLNQGQLTLRLETIDVHALLRSLIAAARNCDIPSPALRADFSAMHYSVSGDPVRLRQALAKLIQNAIKFTSPQGLVEVRTSNDGAHIAIDVIDNGRGFDPQVLPRLFKAFEQEETILSRSTGGLGLGLPIANGLVALHGGTLVGKSEGPGKGASFRVTLPTVVPTKHTMSQVAPTPADAPAAAAGSKGQRRILLVEDHEESREVTARLLGAIGFDVITAGNYRGAVAALRNGPFDLLLCDIQLPDGNGWDVMKIALEHGTTRGLALSGYGNEDDILKSRQAGFSAHLVKPITPERLHKTMSELFGEKRLSV